MHLGTTDIRADSLGVITKFIGLTAGSIVLTLEGEKTVERLRSGDRIITRDQGMAKLASVRQQFVNCTLVRIRAGSLGHTRPDVDLLVGPDTEILLRDWRARALYGVAQAKVPAQRLSDGEFVTLQPKTKTVLYELEFDKQHVIYANGVETATR